MRGKYPERKLGGDEMRFHPAERDLCIAKSMMKSDVNWFLSCKAVGGVNGWFTPDICAQR
jgi:hypothetical protein